MRKVRLFSAIILAASLVGVSGVAYARDNTTAVLGSSEVHNGDYRAAASTVNVAGTVNGDVYAAGGTVNVDGTVNGDVLVAGGTVTVSGVVTGSIRSAGGTVTIDGEVDRNVTSAGGTVQIEPKAHVKGNVYAAGGNVSDNGSIDGDLTVGAGTLLLNSTVGGNVVTQVGQLTVAPSASIGGSLNYTSRNNASIDAKAHITGGVSHHYPAKTKHQPNPWLVQLWKLLAFLATGLVALWLLPRFFADSAAALAKRVWESLGIGVAAIILTPVVAVLLFVTLIGAPLGIILLGLYALTFLAADIAFALWLGRLLGDRSKWWKGDMWSFVAGAALYWLVSLIPILGGIMVAIATTFGFGAAAQTLASRRRK